MPALLIPLVLIGCASTETRLNAAAAIQGQLRASVDLPPLVGGCRKQEPHASIQNGAELNGLLVQERAALRRANARVTRCAGFYDDIRTNFANSKGQTK